MKKSLKVKLILIFSILILIPLIILSTYSCVTTSSSLQKQKEQQLAEVANQTSYSIRQAVDSLNKNVQFLSLNEEVISSISGNDADKQKASQYLANVKKESSDLIENLIVTDASGRAIISDESEKYDADLSSNDYIKKALSGSANESNITKSKLTNDGVIAIAYPIMVDKKVIGTIVGNVKFGSISKILSQVKVGKNGYAYMVDKDGLIVYHPDNKKIFKENVYNIDNAELKDIVSKMKSGEKSGGGYYKYEGVRKFAAFTNVDNWNLIVCADYNEYMSSVSAIEKSTIIIIIISLIIAVILTYLSVTKNIISPIKKLELLMSKAGDGDFTVRSETNTKDEIQVLGDYFNNMLEHQCKIIDHVRKSSEKLAASSEEVSSSAEEISSSTEQVAQNVEEIAFKAETENNSIVKTSEVLVELTSLVQISQNKAITAKKNSHNTMEAATQGRDNVKKTISAIENINNTTSDTEKTLKKLSELSKKVSGIIETINDISDQTQLLALNAAIEAARAGEHGKGFTVVSEEVRELSEQTNIGSKKISSLIGEMVLEIGRAVESMNSDKKAVENGVIIANETDKSFLTIIEAVEQIVGDIDQIVDVTKDEVASSDQIIKLIDTVASAAEVTASNSEEVAATSQQQSSAIQNITASIEETSDMAVSLNNLVEKFKI